MQEPFIIYKMEKLRSHQPEPSEEFIKPGKLAEILDKYATKLLTMRQRTTVHGTPPVYNYSMFSYHIPAYQGIAGAFKVGCYIAIVFSPLIPYYLVSRKHKFRGEAF